MLGGKLTLNSKGLTRFFVLAAITVICFSFMLFMTGCDDDNDGPTGNGGTASSWSIVTPELEGNHFKCAFFLDENEGWIASAGGFLHYTDNGGNTWTRLPNFTNEDIWDIEFLDSDSGWMVGSSGKILRTVDGGNTWRDDLYDITNNDIYGLKFINERKGIASGSKSTVIFSLDGGRRWDTISVSNTSADLYDIDYSDGTGITVGENGTIAIGVNFPDTVFDSTMVVDTMPDPPDTTYLIDTLIDNIIERLATDTISADTTLGFDTLFDTTIVVDTIPDPPDTTYLVDTTVDTSIVDIEYELDTLLYTVDTVWTLFDTVTSGTTENLNSVVLISADYGWAVGDNGTILITNNGGENWTPQTSNVGFDLLRIRFDNSTSGWIVGRNGTILSTTDGGITWNENTSGVNYDLYDIALVGSNNYFAIGTLALLESTNGGTSWELTPTNIVDVPSFMDITFVNDNLGFAVGYAGAIIRTEDGGDTWNYLRRNQENSISEWFTNVQFVDENIGWCVGLTGLPPYNSLILKTIDGGDTWESKVLDASGIEDFIFIDSSIGWIIAEYEIFKTVNGGIVWESQFPLTSSVLNSVSFVDSSNGWVIGMAGTILRTTDGGTNWDNLTDTLLATNLFDVQFVTDSIGWIVGAEGTIWKSVDAGENWTVQTSGITIDFEKVYFINTTTGWVVGYQGTILYTTDGGTTWTSQPSPNNYNLTSVTSKSSTDLWISGENGLLLHTLTGGN